MTDALLRVNPHVHVVNTTAGVVHIYDRALLPTKSSVTDVLYKATEDGYVEINSSQDGNQGQVDGNSSGIRVEDWGFSPSMNTLLAIKQDIELSFPEIDRTLLYCLDLATCFEWSHNHWGPSGN